MHLIRRLFALFIAACVVLPPRPAIAQQTIPTDTIRIAVIGDFGMNNQPEADVASLVASWNPDVVITTGDNNYPLGAAATLDANVGKFYHSFLSPYWGIYGKGAAVNRFFPVLGNHDWDSVSGIPPIPYPYLNYFNLPSGPGQGRYYDVVLGPVHLFALDSDPREPDGITSTSVQADWLRAGLAASKAPWKLVVLHHPPYSSATKSGAVPVMRWPFKAWGASAVFSGHSHIYERLLIDDLPYFISGNGGAQLYPIGTPAPGSQARFNDDYGAMQIDATADLITFRAFDRKGFLRDEYELAASAQSGTLSPAPAWQVMERRVANSEDDVEERASDGAIYFASSDLELTYDPVGKSRQTVGLRFTDVPLPAGSLVTRAYLEFQVNEANNYSATLQIAGERSPNPAGFAAAAGDLTRRARTKAATPWSTIPGWYVAGAMQRTPDLAAIVQEQIAQPGWTSGNALVYVITGEASRTVEAYDGVPWAAPLLHVEYIPLETEEFLYLPQVMR